MSVFSTNQARHLYVATAFTTPNVISTDAAGAIAVKADNDKTHLYFEYMGQGGLTRSDLIDIKNIMYIKATDASKMQRGLKSVTVTLNQLPVGGQDYILKVAIKQFAGISDEDIYWKYGMVHAMSGMSESDFYKKLAISLAKNFSRETTELLSFSLIEEEAEDGPIVTADTKESELTGTYTGLVIDEVEQPWTLGTMAQVPVYFEVYPDAVTIDGDEVIWGTVTENEADTFVKNGKQIADLEYFCMGERGDIYRGVGFPNTIPTKYMVDASEEYHVLDIHYAYVGANEAVQKSEKDLTIVCADKAELNKLISAVNTATGLTVASLN